MKAQQRIGESTTANLEMERIRKGSKYYNEWRKGTNYEYGIEREKYDNESKM